MSAYTAATILENVEHHIAELENRAYVRFEYIHKVCNELSIFDWWNERLSVSQLKAMRMFLKNAIKLGYDGYVCFKVGAAGCASGMWAYKEDTKTGWSPDGPYVYRSFLCKDNWWAYGDDDGNSGNAKTLRELRVKLGA